MYIFFFPQTRLFISFSFSSRLVSSFHFSLPPPPPLCPLGQPALGLPTFNPLSLRSVFSVPPRTLRVAAWQRCHSAFSFLLFFRPLVCAHSDSLHLCTRPPTFVLFFFSPFSFIRLKDFCPVYVFKFVIYFSCSHFLLHTRLLFRQFAFSLYSLI